MKQILPLTLAALLSSELMASDHFLHPFPRVFDMIDKSRYHHDSIKMESFETDTEYIYRFELPGVPREDIDLEQRDGFIVVSVTRKNEIKKDGYSEFSYGYKSRSIQTNDSFDIKKTKAEMKDGILILTIPKKESASSFKIDIL